MILSKAIASSRHRLSRSFGWTEKEKFGDEKQPELGDSLRPLISAFLRDLNYRSPQKAENNALLEAMNVKAAQIGVPYADSHSQKCFENGYSVAANNFPGHPLEVQLYIATYTWLAFVIDDTTSSMADDVAHFQERFYAGEKQPTLLLQGFAEVLRSTYDHFDNVVSNFIILSSLAFINSNVLETRPEFRAMKATKGGVKWSYYFRDKEGLPEAYAYFTYPKALYPDIGEFLEAIPDMGIFINLTNDILSFYKEEKAGETKNYLHHRASYEKKPVLSVLECVITEAVEAFKRTEVILCGRGIYEAAWQTHVRGYLAMHKSNYRYRLGEIGLEESWSKY
ncbi:isoprenoid synthase domain-containing protein [Mycena crocata]|nr:isoprenoid synthase domain-containing protein [Mycena crocata]